ncbi:RNA-binding protein with serine-rich domain 1-like isoform X1 [Leptotrombidium deliense]|uniref:RNA-binding protein with serine-rich domain 1-like isoform X1 n=1 Tax=Leptotrombidium deliense TaxID=299467 RepID=A0A443SS89_9ACAR|nr:RNA-binding protein with serine-rich domain 1-like isoform X1 [Leptotrombidium deliense]
MSKRSEVLAKISKVHVGRLTRNVTKDHVSEIFSVYGIIKSIDLPMDRIHPHLSRGFAYIEFEKAEEAEKAIKYMDGGQIDGQEISVSIVLTPKPRPFAGQLSVRRGGHPGWARRSPRRRRSPPRYRRSPRRSRSRSRSPPRKRRASSSSSSR